MAISNRSKRMYVGILYDTSDGTEMVKKGVRDDVKK